MCLVATGLGVATPVEALDRYCMDNHSLRSLAVTGDSVWMELKVRCPRPAKGSGRRHGTAGSR